MLRVEERIKRYQPYFGVWRLKEGGLLGRGTSGAVFTIYKDQDERLEAALKVVSIPRDDARLKELQAQYSSEEDVRRELRAELSLVKDEIAIMKKIWSESNIVCFEESVIIDRDDTYGWDVLIRMEKLIRVDQFLRGDCERFGYKRDSDLIIRMWDELLSGLLVCEKQRIVHLDIKPENIFYAPGRDHFKLGDFGVSARKESGSRVAENMIVGTLDYMAPEIRQGLGGDSRSDIYSLALMIYQLLNNDRLPFMPAMGAYTEEDRRRAANTRLEGQKPVPRLKNLNSSIMDVLLKCMEFAPENRYQNVESAQNDLRKIIYSGAIEESEGHKSKLLPILIAAASLGLVGVLALLGVRLATGGGQESPDSLDSIRPLISEQPTLQAEETASTELLPEITVDPGAGDSVTVNSGMNFAGIEGGAMGYVDMTITGNISVEALVNGSPVQAMRVSDADQNVQALNWPKDGICFVVPEGESNRTLEMSVRCTDSDGNELYSWSSTGHWRRMASGAAVFMQGDAPEATVEPTATPAPTIAPRPTMDPTPVKVQVAVDGDYDYIGVKAVTGEHVGFEWESEGSVESYTAVITDSNDMVMAELTDTSFNYAEIEKSLLNPDEVYTVRIGARPVNGGDGDIVWTEAKFIAVSGIQEETDLVDGTSSQATIISVQQKLFALGLIAEEDIDGIYNDPTYEAVVEFQRMVNARYGEDTLEVMGFCDPATIEYLTAFEEEYAAAQTGESLTFEIVGTPDENGVVVVSGSEVELTWTTDGTEERQHLIIRDESGQIHFSRMSIGESGCVLPTSGLTGDKVYTAAFGVQLKGDALSDVVWIERQFTCPFAREGIIFENKGYFMYLLDGEIVISYNGYAQPGSTVCVDINGIPMGSVVADEDGWWDSDMTLTEVVAFAGETAQFTFSYEDGSCAVSAFEFSPDSVIPAVKLLEEPTEGATVIRGIAIPESKITVMDEGEGFETCMTDADGVFEVSCETLDMTAGVELAVFVDDADGNSRLDCFTVSEARAFAEIVIESRPEYIGSSDCLIEGTAEPGEKLLFMWGQSDLESVTVENPDGFFSVTLPVPGPASGDPAELIVCYEDISDGCAVINIPRDDTCGLTAPATVTDQMTEIQLSGEPGAKVVLFVNGGFVSEYSFDEEGGCALPLPALNAGDALRLEAGDDYGNHAVALYTVEKGEYLPLQAVMSPAPGEGGAMSCPDGLSFSVSGEPGAMFRLTTVTDGETAAAEQTLDASGSSLLTFTDLADGSYTFTFEYIERPGDAFELTAALDNTAPAIGTDTESIPEHTRGVVIQTEPGARLDIARDGVSIHTFHADENGEAVLDVVDIGVGEYRLTATDAAGNVNEQSFNVRARAALTFAGGPVPEGDNLVFNGACEPLANITAEVNGNTLTGPASEYGDWMCCLPAEWFPENQEVEVTFRYEEGGDALTVSVYLDTLCELSAAHCGEGAVSIEGTAEPGAAITLRKDGVLIAETTASDEGTFSMALPEAARPGDQFTVRAEDVSGNAAEQTLSVSEAERQPIMLFADPISNVSYISGSSDLTIYGTAERGQDVEVEISDGVSPRCFTVELPGAGTASTEAYSLTVTPAELFGADCDVTITVRYADGLARSRAKSLQLRYDNTAPSLYCDSERVEEGQNAIEAWTDPGERVVLLVNNTEADEATADENGFVSFQRELIVDELITLRVTDLAGNTAEQSFTVNPRLPFATGAVTIAEDSAPQGGTVRAQGWMAVSSEENVRFSLRFENEGMVWTVPLNGVTRMSDEEFTENFSQHAGSVRADIGYWIDQEVSIDDQLAVGSAPSVRLAIENSAERLIFEGDSFTVDARVVVEAEAQPAYIGSGFAIGFDAAQPARVYANDDVLLTGWFYGSDENGYEIVSVECAPVEDPENITKIELTECDLDELNVGNTVATLPRDVLTACSPEVPGALPDVQPDENRPGFMLYLELPMSKGEYIITLVTQVDGPYERTASVRVSLDRSVDLLPASLPQRIADAWANAEDAPVITIDGAEPSGITDVYSDSIALSWAAPADTESYTLTVSDFDGNIYAEHTTADTGARLPMSSLPTGELLAVRISTGSAEAVTYIRRIN